MAGELVPEVDSPSLEQEGVINGLNEAIHTFKQEGMQNLYDGMNNKEKQKWLERINDPTYFEGNTADVQLQISGIYEVAKNQYYVLGWSTDLEEVNAPKAIFELILLEEDERYFSTYAAYPCETILSQEDLALYIKAEQEESNVAIEYNKVNRLNELDDYVNYLDEAIQELDEEVINDSGKGEVTQYVQYALEDLSSKELVAVDNTIEIEKNLLTQMKETLLSANEQFNQMLQENEIDFNKSLDTILRVKIEKANFKKPIYIQLPSELEALEEVSGLRILLDQESYVYVEGADLSTLAGLKIKIERLRDKSTYEISFMDENNELMTQIEYPITFAFPAQDEFSTVIATYDETNQNWGGQYDPASGTISFGTKYSGSYQVVDNQVKILDIDQLPSSQQSAIKFMVSKGYLSLENDRFYPDSSFTRYEFAEALVKMFFALDNTLTTTLTDVPKESSYYPYVASGETYDIIKGYTDQTFRGNINIPKEQVISLCARTIADKKGYIYPENIEDYMKFADAKTISKWAAQDIALAVKSGLIASGGNLLPGQEITKAESAEVLYQLFMLLYETSPNTVVEITATQKTYSILGVLALLVLVIWLIRRFIKRHKIILTMIACTFAIIVTLIIGFKGGF